MTLLTGARQAFPRGFGVGRKAQCFREVLCSDVTIARAELEQTKVGVGGAVVRIVAQRLLEGLLRIGWPIEFRICGTHEVVDRRVVFISGDRALGETHRLIDAAVSERRGSSEVMRAGARRG